jgi:hypothetical protein
MRHWTLAALAVMALATGAHAATYRVATATWTAGGSATKALAFQNTSDGLDVEILKIEVVNATTGSAITGGLMQFWAYASDSLTHGGTSQVLDQSLRAVEAAQPSYISLSTGPVDVTYERAGPGAMPLIRPLYVNNDEGATANLSDSWSHAEPGGAPILLPRGGDRAIILEQKNLAATSVTAGVVLARIYYLVK